MYVARSRSRVHFALTMLKAIFGRKVPQHDFEEIATMTLVIDSRAPRLRVAFDGEIEKMRPPLRYAIRPAALRVLVPRVTLG